MPHGSADAKHKHIEPCGDEAVGAGLVVDVIDVVLLVASLGPFLLVYGQVFNEGGTLHAQENADEALGRNTRNNNCYSNEK